jgi:hypothetical protein
MKKLQALLVLPLLFISLTAMSCDCKNPGPLDSLREISYRQSDIVFLGELLDFDTLDYTYTFKVLEVFKRDTGIKIIHGKYFSSCSRFPRDKDRWIIYANFREGNLIDIDQCLASRSELKPYGINCYDPSPPPANDEKEKEAAMKKSDEFKAGALKDWYAELEWLRESK